MMAIESSSGPLFPPLLTGRATVPPADPWTVAREGAAAGTLGAGDLIFSTDTDCMALALVLEPTVSRERCTEMQALAMAAFSDAIGAVIPPEIGVSFTWPDGVRLNGALIGAARLDVGPGETPDWLVVALAAQLAPLPGLEPGRMPDRTSFTDEGCNDVAAHDLIESTARHLVHWLHRWESDGFAPVHRHWWDRRDQKVPLMPGIEGRLLGIDERGNAVLDGPRTGLSVLDARP